jgi:O-antigen/teichoic acid export membrane protein
MSPRKFVRDSFGFAFSQYIVRATLMARTLVAARLLGPEAMGAWNAIQLVLDNGSLMLFGTQQGLDQVVPARIGAGDADGERRVKRAALFNIVMLTLLYALCCLVWISVGRSRIRDAWGFAGVGVALGCVAATNLSNYQTSIQRSHGDFATVSAWMLIQGAIGGLLGMALTPFIGNWGLLGGWAVGCFSALVFTTLRSVKQAPLVPAPAAEGLDLVQTGFPLFVFLASSLVMRQLDRIIILRFLGIEMLGYYGLAVMVLALMLYAPDAVTFVLYPKLQREFSASGNDPESIRTQIEKVLRASSVLVPALAAGAFFFAGPSIQFLLPKFLPGVTAMRVLCFGAVGLAFANFASIVLMTVGRQSLLMPGAVLSVVAGAGFDMLAVRLGYGITGVAWATVATYSVSGALLLTMALTGLSIPPRRVIGLVFRLFLPMAVAIALALALHRAVPWVGSPILARRALRLALEVAAFAALYFLAVHPLVRGLGLRQVLSDLNLPVLSPLMLRLQGRASRQDPS